MTMSEKSATDFVYHLILMSPEKFPLNTSPMNKFHNAESQRVSITIIDKRNPNSDTEIYFSSFSDKNHEMKARNRFFGRAS